MATLHPENLESQVSATKRHLPSKEDAYIDPYYDSLVNILI